MIAGVAARKPYLCAWRDADARWWRDIVGHEEIGLQRLARGDLVAGEIGDAFAGEERVVDQEAAGEAPGRLVEDRIRRVGDDVGGARAPHYLVAAEQVLDRRGRDRGTRPQRVDGGALGLELAGEAERHQAHAALGERVGGVPRDPVRPPSRGR